MKAYFFLFALLAAAANASAAPHVFLVSSPTHEQTYAYGSERHQAWMTRGPDRHLALSTEFTNDPYVDRINTRQYDDFTFDFPDIRLGSDGHTFFYRAPGGQRIAVARRHHGPFGLEQVDLLPGSLLIIKSPHGYLSLTLLVSAGPLVDTASL